MRRAPWEGTIVVRAIVVGDLFAFTDGPRGNPPGAVAGGPYRGVSGRVEKLRVALWVPELAVPREAVIEVGAERRFADLVARGQLGD